MRNLVILAIGLVLLGTSVSVEAQGKGKARGIGLNDQARQELVDAGVTKYRGEFTPVGTVSKADGWTQHLFDPAYQGNGLPAGPVCIAGTPYSAYSKGGDPKKLLIFLQGGGACWQGFTNCNILAEAQDPTQPLDAAAMPPGIFSDDADNPVDDWSIVYLPYCDGSVFVGDNDVADDAFPFGPVRYHRGLRNVTAGIDLAKSLFPDARRIMVAGSSAGGVGAASFAPFLTRFAFGDQIKLSVFNDAGPVAVNPDDTAAINARADDWQFGQFYPASCTECDPRGQSTPLILWRLDNDRSIRESFYSTDGDTTNRFFMNLLGSPISVYRDLLLTEHGKLEAAHPARYKRFIVFGEISHTALQAPRFFETSIDGVPLVDWTEDFLQPGARAYREKNTKGKGPKKNSWVDLTGN